MQAVCVCVCFFVNVSQEEAMVRIPPLFVQEEDDWGARPGQASSISAY